jgi:hypothetical protein
MNALVRRDAFSSDELVNKQIINTVELTKLTPCL